MRQLATMWPCVSLPKRTSALRQVVESDVAMGAASDYPATLFGGWRIVSLFCCPGGFRALAWALLAAENKMQSVVKGMVQVHSVTYRIVRMRAGHYDVVRLLDDVRVGAFSVAPRQETVIEGDSPELIREVARAALQGGRTTWTPRRMSA